jgi:adenylate cyclase
MCSTIPAYTGSISRPTAFELAIPLDPNFSDGRFALALASAGEHERVAQYAQTYMRLNPFYPPYALHWLGVTCYMREKFTQALAPLHECTSRAPNILHAHTCLAPAYAQFGRMKEAHTEAAEAIGIEPAFTIERAYTPSIYMREMDVKNLFDGFCKAGLPER